MHLEGQQEPFSGRILERIGHARIFRLQRRSGVPGGLETHKMLWPRSGIRLMHPATAACGADRRRPAGAELQICSLLYITCIIRGRIGGLRICIRTRGHRGRSGAQTGSQGPAGASARGGQAGRHVSMHLRAARRGFSIIDKLSIIEKPAGEPGAGRRKCQSACMFAFCCAIYHNSNAKISVIA